MNEHTMRALRPAGSPLPTAVSAPQPQPVPAGILEMRKRLKEKKPCGCGGKAISHPPDVTEHSAIL
jgi:hypothetical protein